MDSHRPICGVPAWRAALKGLPVGVFGISLSRWAARCRRPYTLTPARPQAPAQRSGRLAFVLLKKTYGVDIDVPADVCSPTVAAGWREGQAYGFVPAGGFDDEKTTARFFYLGKGPSVTLGLAAARLQAASWARRSEALRRSGRWP